MTTLIAQANQALERLIPEVDPQFYPQCHLAAPAGWINDPNGLICIDGCYHVFYQHYPYNENWGPMHWGHATSEDLVHWQHQPIALAPGDEFDRDGCFSGSAVDDHGVLTLIYTGHVWLGDAGDDSQIREVQCLATSHDGVTFTKHGAVLTPPDGIEHFRDPKVWWQDDMWYMVIGARENDRGQIRLYRSVDLREWQFDRIVAQATEDQGYMWECPDMFTLNGKQVLMFSPQGLAAQGYENRNRFQSGYLLGEWQPGTDFQISQPFTEMDYGHDFYAPQSFTAADGRRMVIGWMDMWESTMPSKAHKWAGALTLPRELSLSDDGRILQQPAWELSALRQTAYAVADSTLTHEPRVLSPQVDAHELRCELDIGTGSDAERYGVRLGDDANSGNGLTLAVDNQSRRLVLRRHYPEFGISGERSVPLPEGDRLCLQLFIDRSSVEVFVNHGQFTLTSRLYPSAAERQLSLFAENGKAHFSAITHWTLANHYLK